jgi:glycerol-1-phosphate dehydrogenase [NAD(P)+]
MQENQNTSIDPSLQAQISNRLGHALLTGVQDSIAAGNPAEIEESKRLLNCSFGQTRNKGTQKARQLLEAERSGILNEVSDNVVVVESVAPVIDALQGQASIITEKVPYDFVKGHHPQVKEVGPTYFVDQIETGQDLEKLISKLKSDGHTTLLGIGGGRTLDILKFIGMETEQTMLAIPSSFTTHVYASPKIHALEPIKELGYKLTIDGPAPHLALLDTNMLTDLEGRNTRLIYAGFGDIMAFINAREDWHLSCKRGKAKLSDQADAFVVEAIDRLEQIDTSGPLASWISDYSYIQVLLCNITDWVGSAPASGAEHLFAKCAEDLADEMPLHGELVALGTLLMARLRGENLEQTKRLFKKFHLPTSLKEIGLTQDQAIEALGNSLEYGQYKNRYTILDELDNQPKVFQELVENALQEGIISE